jgi:hypothetical protein
MDGKLTAKPAFAALRPGRFVRLIGKITPASVIVK